MLDFIAALVAVLASLVAVKWTNAVQRSESSKERQVAAASDAVVSAFNVVRYCHRDEGRMRDFDSAFDTSLRALAMELLAVPGGRRFMEEALEWRARLQMDAIPIMQELQAEGADGVDHDSPPILDLRRRVRTFSDFVTAWMAAGARRTPGLVIADLRRRPRDLFAGVRTRRRAIVSSMLVERSDWHGDADHRHWLRATWPRPSGSL